MTEDNAPKFFDVAQPGSSAPSPTSRPVITNAPQVDPMMNEKPAEAPSIIRPAAHEPDPLPTATTPHTIIDAGQAFNPPKPTKSWAHRLLVLAIAAVVIGILSLAVYPLVRSQF